MISKSQKKRAAAYEARKRARANEPEDLSQLKAKKPKRHRPKVPDSVGLALALVQGIRCGCGCGQLAKMGVMKGHGLPQMEHDPPLEARKYDPATRTYDPPANDPRFLAWWRDDCHDKKTHGPGGTKRITTKGGDNHTQDRVENLNTAHGRHLAKMRVKVFGKGN